jgi:outer membrane protein TolC
MNSKIRLNIVILTWLFAASSIAQTLTLDECYQMAESNYPLVKQYELLEKSKAFSIANANRAYLPQIGIYGQATYQSEVTQIPITLPNVDIPALSKDQYRLYGEISQSITDLFTTKKQSNLVKANSEIETQKIEIELYKLRERINSLFFGSLLIEAQIKQTELLQKDIQSGIDKIEVAVANGVALQSDVDNLKTERLKIRQRAIELRAAKKGYADMLSLFIGKPIDENTLLEKPQPQIISNTVNRPELQLFELQKKAFDAQNHLLTVKNMPRISLFFQGGMGRPGLNMLSNNFDPYYIAGVRLNWNLSGFYTFNNERKILKINQNSVNIQQSLFMFNTNLTLKQQNVEIDKMQELIASDNDIIKLRENVKNAAQTQLAFGTATTNDYLIAVNAEDQARQNLLLHEIQLLMAQYSAKTTSGN